MYQNPAGPEAVLEGESIKIYQNTAGPEAMLDGESAYS